MTTHKSFESRLADFPANSDTCWLWPTKITKAGYARVTRWKDGVPRPHYAHRLAYEMLVGPVPEGLELDHVCRVKHCVNPSHLEPVTHQTNMERAFPHRRRGGQRPVTARHYQAGQDCCINGHPYGDSPIVVRRVRGDYRICRICKNRAWRIWWRKRQGKHI